MKTLKRFSLMFGASLSAFLLLASLDDYKAVILPFFIRDAEKAMPVSLPKTEELRGFIKDFNDLLSRAYLLSDLSMVDSLPADESIKKSVVDDISFLVRSGKVMEIAVDNIDVEGVDVVQPATIKVKTKEVVSLTYLNLTDRKVIVPKQVAEHRTLYLLDTAEGEYKVAGFETLGVKGVEVAEPHDR